MRKDLASFGKKKVWSYKFIIVLFFFLGSLFLATGSKQIIDADDLIYDTLTLPVAYVRNPKLSSILDFVGFYLFLLEERFRKPKGRDYWRCLTYYDKPIFFLTVRSISPDTCKLYVHVGYEEGYYVKKGDSVEKYLWSEDYRLKYVLPVFYGYGLVFFHKKDTSALCESLFSIFSDTTFATFEAVYHPKNEDFIYFYCCGCECLMMYIYVTESSVIPSMFWFDPLKY